MKYEKGKRLYIFIAFTISVVLKDSSPLKCVDVIQVKVSTWMGIFNFIIMVINLAMKIRWLKTIDWDLT